MLQHLVDQERHATVGGVQSTTASVVGNVVAFGGMGYGVYLMVNGSIGTGALVFLGGPVAGMLLYQALGGRFL